MQGMVQGDPSAIDLNDPSFVKAVQGLANCSKKRQRLKKKRQGASPSFHGSYAVLKAASF